MDVFSLNEWLFKWMHAGVSEVSAAVVGDSAKRLQGCRNVRIPVVVQDCRAQLCNCITLKSCREVTQ